MRDDQTIARALHDVGAALWFGGSLMGAVGLNAASAAVRDPSERARVAGEGWRRWGPWRAAGIAAHVAGSVALVWGNKARLAAQQDAMTVNLVKTGVFFTALATTAYASRLGRLIAEDEPFAVESAVEPARETPEEVAKRQRRLKVLQYAVPVLTGANVAIASKMGEQQRPTNIVEGVLDRVRPAA